MAGEHGYFSERGRILQLESALASRDALINEQQEKIDLLMQPIPEVHGDFPWQMVRRIAELEEALRELRTAANEGVNRADDYGRLCRLVIEDVSQALDDKGEAP